MDTTIEQQAAIDEALVPHAQRTMDTTIEQQAAIDEALVPHAQRLRIRRSNFRLLSDIKSKESTLQLVYDDLRICPFFKAFLVTTDVPEIYMQEFWATTTIHHHAIRFKMDYKSISNTNAYKEYYAIATRAAPPKPKASTRRTRNSFDTSITPPTATASPKLTASAKGKQTAKASKSKSLSALSKVAMTKAQQLKLVTKRSMQQIHISQASGSGTDEGTGSIPGVPDAPSDESEEELSWNSTDDEGADNKGKDGDDDEEDEGDDGEEGDGDDDNEDDDGEEGNNDDDDQEVERDDDKDDEEEGRDDAQEYDEEESDEETMDEESFDPISQTPKKSEDEGNCDEDLGLNISGEEGRVEEEEEDELYRDVNINQGRGLQKTLEVEDLHSSSVSSQFVTNMLNPTLDVVPSTIIQNLPNFGLLFRFDDRLRILETNLSEFMHTNQFAGAVFAIPEIVQ
nr:hypothetical protein [Tanacetum cinerariifolium]